MVPRIEKMSFLIRLLPMITQGGAKKVIISAPSEDAPMFLVGVNEQGCS